MANSLMIGSAKMGSISRSPPGDLFPEKDLVEECRAIASGYGGHDRILRGPEECRRRRYLHRRLGLDGEEDKLAERIALLKPLPGQFHLLKATGNADCIFLHCLPAVKGTR